MREQIVRGPSAAGAARPRTFAPPVPRQDGFRPTIVLDRSDEDTIWIEDTSVFNRPLNYIYNPGVHYVLFDWTGARGFTANGGDTFFSPQGEGVFVDQPGLYQVVFSADIRLTSNIDSYSVGLYGWDDPGVWNLGHEYWDAFGGYTMTLPTAHEPGSRRTDSDGTWRYINGTQVCWAPEDYLLDHTECVIAGIASTPLVAGTFAYRRHRMAIQYLGSGNLLLDSYKKPDPTFMAWGFERVMRLYASDIINGATYQSDWYVMPPYPVWCAPGRVGLRTVGSTGSTASDLGWMDVSHDGGETWTTYAYTAAAPSNTSQIDFMANDWVRLRRYCQNVVPNPAQPFSARTMRFYTNDYPQLGPIVLPYGDDLPYQRIS